jgi:hypothetical protein
MITYMDEIGSRHDLFEVPSWHLPQKTEDIT